MQAGAGSDKEMEMSEIIRLDKYLADMGCGTRSQVKQMIRKGQVEINGEKIKKPEQKITTAQDRVCVAGTEIRYEKYRYYRQPQITGIKQYWNCCLRIFAGNCFRWDDWIKIQRDCCC
mgnify:CR=1 FL=1